MTKTYTGMVHLNGSLIAAIDYETLGRRAGYHDIVQMAVVPLNSDLRPYEGIRPFYTTMRPTHPERVERQAMRVHGLDLDHLLMHAPEPGRVQDLLLEWYEKLELPFGKKLVPLAHNWAFEKGFTEAWLGADLMETLFYGTARDSMLVAGYINDKEAMSGNTPPFPMLGLKSMALKFGIINEKPHDAYHDSITEAEVYRTLVKMDKF